jgi:hypothetical protein
MIAKKKRGVNSAGARTLERLWLAANFNLVNLEIQSAPRVPTLYDQDGYYFVYDKKFRPLLNLSPPGQTQFEQIFERQG